MDNIKIKKLLLIIFSILIVSTGVIGLTLSVFTSTDQVVNKFEVGDVNIKNEEEFTEGEYADKTKIDKIVTIKNVTTKTPALVRVNITPRWVEIDEQGNETPWSGVVSKGVIELEFYNENIIDSKDYSDDSEKPPEDKWMKDNDNKTNYYYYTSILGPGDSTKEILKSVKINLKDKDNKNLVENPEDYYGKTLIVDVNSEAVQPTQDAYEDAWGTIPDNITTMLDKLLGIKSESSNI